MIKVTKQNRKWVAAGLAIGLFFLALSFSHIDIKQSVNALTRISLSWALLVFVCGLAFIALKTLRWSIILKPVLHDDFSYLLRLVYAGTAANLIIAHTGEFVRAGFLRRKKSVSASAVLATIGLERTLDFVALLILITLALIIDPRVTPLLWTAGLISLGFIILGISLALALLNPDSTIASVCKKLLYSLPDKPGEWITARLKKGREGLGTMRQPRTILLLIVMSVLQWIWIVAAVWACAQAVNVPIPVSGAIAVFVLTLIGLTLPSSPVQLGTIQLAFIVGIELVGKDAAHAFAASLVYTCFINVAMLAIGIVCWFYLNANRTNVATDMVSDDTH